MFLKKHKKKIVLCSYYPCNDTSAGLYDVGMEYYVKLVMLCHIRRNSIWKKETNPLNSLMGILNIIIPLFYMSYSNPLPTLVTEFISLWTKWLHEYYVSIFCKRRSPFKQCVPFRKQLRGHPCCDENCWNWCTISCLFLPFILTFCEVTNSVRTPAPCSAPRLDACSRLRSSNNQAEVVLVL